MIRRCVALGIAEAQRGFRRVKGHMNMPSLVAAMRPAAKAVAVAKKAAQEVDHAAAAATRTSTRGGAFPSAALHAG